MAEHYFSGKQSTPFAPFKIKVRSRQKEIELFSSAGIFSGEHLDKGTEIMLKYADLSFLKDGGKFCDLGCGYGVVGIIVKLERPEAEVTFVDSNERAIKLVKMNLELNNIKDNVSTEVGDILSQSTESFDLILTNPPYNAGRAICFAFVEQSFAHLNKGGSLQLVCRRQKGGDVLSAKMKEVFGNMTVIGQKSGFRLYSSIKQ